MEVAPPELPEGQARSDSTLGCESILRQFPFGKRSAYLGSVAIVILLCVADFQLPRGATAAIGYCVVPVLAVGTRRPAFLFGMTFLSTLLTWVAYSFEPPGGPWWISLFERVMVTWVVWLTLLLVWRRAALVSALARQSESLERATRELERSNNELQTFASVAAHDLRAPIHAIGLLAELLSLGNPAESGGQWQECVRSIKNEVNQMNGLIQSLLTYGRVGGGNLTRVSCECEVILAEVKQRLRADLEHKHGQVTNDPLPVVPGDPALLTELFQNLVENAIKYSSDAPPHIHLSATRNTAGWQFSVQDNGIGLAPGESEQVFQRYHQAHRGGARRGGVGLGLATCKRIVERHGGEIGVKSAPGQGAIFHFLIPD